MHPRDPYKRVDILATSRKVTVSLSGIKIASSSRCLALHETGLPVRYYFPKIEVQMGFLHASTMHSSCPYKGTASYYTVKVNGQIFDNIVWWYPTPSLESIKIAGYVCFYNDKVDLEVEDPTKIISKNPSDLVSY